jgi:NADPH-dependent ferric siderophore reductase
VYNASKVWLEKGWHMGASIHMQLTLSAPAAAAAPAAAPDVVLLLSATAALPAGFASLNAMERECTSFSYIRIGLAVGLCISMASVMGFLTVLKV